MAIIRRYDGERNQPIIREAAEAVAVGLLEIPAATDIVATEMQLLGGREGMGGPAHGGVVVTGPSQGAIPDDDRAPAFLLARGFGSALRLDR